MRKGRDIIIYYYLYYPSPRIFFFSHPKPTKCTQKIKDAPKAAIILGGGQLPSWMQQAFGQYPGTDIEI
jgi:hypothetical protein